MNADIESILSRADELLKELSLEYRRCLDAKEISGRARSLTNEILEKVRAALDQSMYLVWRKHTLPNLSKKDAERARVYFPIAHNIQSFHSILGRCKMSDLQTANRAMYDYLLSVQPFSASANIWLERLRVITAESKHIRLSPQTRSFRPMITVYGKNGGSVGWDPSSIKFEGGINIMGAPIDPTTQRPMQTSGVTIRDSRWVSFLLSDHRVDAHFYCQSCISNARSIIAKFLAVAGDVDLIPARVSTR